MELSYSRDSWHLGPFCFYRHADLLPLGCVIQGLACINYQFIARGIFLNVHACLCLCVCCSTHYLCVCLQRSSLNAISIQGTHTNTHAHRHSHTLQITDQWRQAGTERSRQKTKAIGEREVERENLTWFTMRSLTLRNGLPSTP